MQHAEKKDSSVQIVCPSCASRYRVAAKNVDGRKTKCAKCGTIWAPKAEATTPAAQEKTAQPVSHQAGASVQQMQAALKAEFSAAEGTSLPQEMNAEDTLKGLDDPAVSEENQRVIEELRQKLAKEEAKKKSPPATARPKIAQRPPIRRFQGSSERYKVSKLQVILTFLSIVLPSILFIAREPIVEAFPQLGSFYETIGMPVNLRGVEFRNIQVSNIIDSDITTLIVKGEVVNISKEKIALNRLRVAIVGPDKKELVSWTTPPPRASLDPRTFVRFETRYVTPPAGASDVTVRFLNPNDVQSESVGDKK
jgi:predicted Zn finger-like uncharacterized protein